MIVLGSVYLIIGGFWGLVVWSVFIKNGGAGILRPSFTQPMGNVFKLLGMTKIYSLEK